MKKYIQYNQSHYRENPPGLVVASTNQLVQKNVDTSIPVGNPIRSPGALDLSGKQRASKLGHQDKQQWNRNEQETALDLSGYGKNEDQNEALDLSKPSSVSKPDVSSKVPYHHGNPPQRLVSTPPSSRYSRSPAGQQYSLLQAALNSTLPNAGLNQAFDAVSQSPTSLHPAFDAVSQSTSSLHPAFDSISQSTALLLQQRALNFSTAGMSVGDFSRAIKPFSTMSSRPLGFSMLQGPHAAGAVIQGVHKPIAITTPQPHNSTDTKSQSVSNSTVSVTDANQSVPSTSNQGFAVNQPNYSSGYHTQSKRSLNSRKLSGTDIKRYSLDSVKEPERYMIHSTKDLNHHVSNVHTIPTHPIAGFTCNQCSKTFKTKAALKLHMTVHKTSEERQYGCSICNRRFLHRHHLVVHQRKHSGEKPFKCTACSKTFMAIFLLHKHLRKHTRETGPVSQISMDQLKQLHDKKLISGASEPLPFLKPGPEKDVAPVIVLDDDDGVNATVEIKINDVGKYDTNNENKDQKILEIIGNNQKMILDKLKADLMTKHKTKESKLNQNEGVGKAEKVDCKEKIDCDVKVDAEIQPGNSELSNTNETEGNSVSKVNEDDDNTDYNYILKDSEDEGKDSGAKENLNVQSNQVVKNESDPNNTPHFKETDPNPIPEYASDDELELDCITGEIRIIGKKTDKIEQKNENEENAENVISTENDIEIKGPCVQSVCEDDAVKDVIESLVKQTAETVDINVVKLTDSVRIETHNDKENVAEDMETTSNDKVEEVEVNKETKIAVTEELLNVNKDGNSKNENVEQMDEDVEEKAVDKDDNVVKDDAAKEDSADMEDRVVTKERVVEEHKNVVKKDTLVMDDGDVKKESMVKEDGDVLVEQSSSSDSGNSVASKPIVHESRNIFDKITQMKNMKDMKDFKSCRTDKEYVEKEVEIILRNIKRVVCKDEGLTAIDNKKPKLIDVNLENAPKLTCETEMKLTSMEGLGGCRVPVDKPKHSKGKKKGRKVKCEVCARRFHSNHYLLLHMAVHKRNPMLQSLKKAKDYQMKAMGFVNKSNVTCEVCKKIFKFQKSLNSHMRVHSEKLIQTKLYRKAFRDFMAEAAPPNSRNCDKDKSQTVSVVESESHIRPCSDGEHESNSVATSTSACKRRSLDNVVSDEISLELDDEPPIKVIVGDDNIRRYLCHACDNTYTTKQKLRMHALIHKDNCFLCDVCGKSFFRQITLQKHISTHKLPRPHVCEVCKKTFIHRSSLMRHKVAHEKSAAPGLKQQVADRNFEMKMLDTYSILKQERMLKQMQKRQDLTERSPVKLPNKYDALDLSVKIKTEDQCLPPVLSPVIASLPSSTNSIPWNLSPPLITQEGMSGRLSNNKTPEKYTDRISESERNSGDYEQASVSNTVKTRTDSTCSESDIVTVEGHKVVQKRVRKTRVYPTSCRVCKEVFPNVMLLKSHMSVHNTIETHLYECHICRHRFTQSCSLLRHLKTSCQENKMKCVPCGRTFHRRNTFEQHMRLHQGGPPNLDGSFYDKRPDEVAMHEERESDIENNNLSKVQQTVTTQELNKYSEPLTLKIINVVSKSEPNITEDQDNCDDDSDDARTYLYSEGEVHSRYNSDFSDNDWSPPQSPKKIAAPQDLSMSSANMTLNLLSAVCSDIRNAEKEKELKQQELEEKQKELETIEILANLKRGAMQKSLDHTAATANRRKNSNAVPSSVLESNINTVSYQSTSQHLGTKSTRTQNTNSMTGVDSVKYAIPSSVCGLVASSALVSPLPSNHKDRSTFYPGHPQHNIPSVIEGFAGGDPKIPTVVLEVTADSEKQRRAQAHRTWAGRSASVPALRESNIAKDGSLTPEIPKMKNHYPAIQERLSLLMKAQGSTPLSETTKFVHNPSASCSPSANDANFLSQISPGRHLPSHTQALANLDTPQDLSVKRSLDVTSVSNLAKTNHQSSSKTSLPSPSVSNISDMYVKSLSKEKHKSDIPRSNSSRSLPSDLSRPGQVEVKKVETAPVPPPLVPMFHCELCSRVLYSKTDLHLHMMEHGRSAGALYKTLISGKKQASQDSPVDFTKPGPSNSVGVSPVDTKPPMSLSLNIPSKSSDKILESFNHSVAGSQQDSPGTQLKSFMSSAPKISEALSPVTSSDYSDSHSLPSPSTPSTPGTPGTPGASLDLLRQELRLKIYARRRSQGLDDLKVEFKQPEPTEMTEAEKIKLLYRRECNRQAAQRSRMRKKDLVDSLLEELHTEEVVNSDLRRKMEALTAEKISLLKALNAHECAQTGCGTTGTTSTLSFPSISCVESSNKLVKLDDDEHVLSSQKEMLKQCFDITKHRAIDLDGVKDLSVRTSESVAIKTNTECVLDDKSIGLDVLHVLDDIKKEVNETINCDNEFRNSEELVLSQTSIREEDDSNVLKVFSDRKYLGTNSVPNSSVT